MAEYSIEVAIPNVGPQGPQGPAGEFGDLEAPEDGIIYGRKDAEWVDMTSPANLQVRRGTAAEVAAITPLEGEPVWATDTKKLVVGDGSTTGGIAVGEFPLAGSFKTTGAAFVSGAGMTAFNGIYFITGTLGEKPLYEKDGGGATIAFSFGSWYISNAEGDIYEAAEEVDFPYNALQWASIEEGFDPAPTVAQGAGAGKIAVSLLAQAAGVSGNETAVGSVDLQLERAAASQVASGEYSAIIAGRNNTASGQFALATGEGALAHRKGMIALGHPRTDTFPQLAQSVQFGLRCVTTDDASTAMFSGLANTDPFTVPLNTAIFATAEIAAIEPITATESAYFIRKFGLQNVGGSLALIGSVTTVGTDHKTDNGYAVAITTAGIAVTGDANKTLRWTASIRGIEMAIS
jgi:hypothetical protein